jgi:hypothetical protein
MTNAPERIWAWRWPKQHVDGIGQADWSATLYPNGHEYGATEYARIDILTAAQARIAELEGDLNLAKYGERDFSWSIQQDLVADLRTRIAELEAALPRAWEMGRDAATMLCDQYPYVEGVKTAIRDLAPPADLAAQIGAKE